MAGIYIHIPFCKQRCIYCDFYSTTRKNEEKEYVEAVCNELIVRKNSIDEPIQTLYLGGGTPSLLNTESIEKVVQCIKNNYCTSTDWEFTVEANPDDITREWLQCMTVLGVNRISMGIQTFHDPFLKLIRRRHNKDKAIQAVRLCQEYSFKNISIDLIYGLPGQTLEQWQADVAQAVELNVQHISAYALIYEENTPLWKMRERNEVQEADEELSLKMFEHLISELKKNGFEHYEISNFGKPGFHSRHNSSYWNNTTYLGCGAAAHSFVNGERMYNIADIGQYIKDMQLCRAGIREYRTVCHCETLSRYEQYNDRIITRLRTAEGLDLDELEKDFGKELKSYCLEMAKPYLNEKTLQIVKPNGHLQGVLKLSYKGIFLSDGIMSDLLWVDD